MPDDVAPVSLPVDAWLDRLAARTATPGGGSVAALAGALAAAVGAMALQFSVGRKADTADADAKLAASLAALDSLRGVLLELCEEDQAAYAGWRATKDLPDDDPAKLAATAASIAVPLATMAAALRTLEAAVEVDGLANPWLRGDLLCCCDLAVAAVRCGRHNVIANALEGSGDRQEADTLLGRAVKIVQRLDECP